MMRTHNSSKSSNKSSVLWTATVALVAVLAVGARADGPVLLRDVGALVFRAGETVVDTRTGEVLPRLQCAYNPLDDERFLPGTVMCENKGVDDRGSVVWKCSADMDDALAFDNVQVSCEGYSRPGDRYIREGSCVLKYTLALTPAAAHKQQQPQHKPQPQPEYHYRVPRPDPHEQDYRRHQHHNDGRPHYYANRDINNNNVGEARVVSVWTFSNVLLVVLAAYVVGRCMCRYCASKPARGTANENGHVEDNAAPSSSSGWRWWFPLAAYAVGRHDANRARNSRVYNVPPPQSQPQTAYECPAPSAPAPDSCSASSPSSDSDSPATGHMSRRTGFADTVVR